jgi:CRP-like cAMP-binding protein
VLLAELEAGDELLFILSGKAKVTVGTPESGEAETLGEVGPGDVVGELAMLTGALRSASVIALEPMEGLLLPRDQVLKLMSRFPALGQHFLEVIAARLLEADEALSRALHPNHGPSSPLEGLDQTLRRNVTHPRPLGHLLRRAFQELVVERRRELPFLALSWFLGSVLSLRVLFKILELLGHPLQTTFRSAYAAGVVLLIGVGCVGQFAFRHSIRKVLAAALGVGAGLVANELSVLLAFDIFYKDIFTRDSRMTFDADLLYHRSESVWAIAVVLLLLVQATYAWRFYRRAYYLIRDRLSAFAARSRSAS